MLSLCTVTHLLISNLGDLVTTPQKITKYIGQRKIYRYIIATGHDQMLILVTHIFFLICAPVLVFHCLQNAFCKHTSQQHPEAITKALQHKACSTSLRQCCTSMHCHMHQGHQSLQRHDLPVHFIIFAMILIIIMISSWILATSLLSELLISLLSIFPLNHHVVHNSCCCNVMESDSVSL